MDGARKQGFDAREQHATAKQRSWEANAALGRLLPAFTARGSITRNQFAAELPAGTFPGQTDAIAITPQTQLDATFQLDVPLIDVAQYHRYQHARHLKGAAEEQRAVVEADMARAVAQAYYTYLGASALQQAAERGLRLAEENSRFVENRSQLGVATNLDLERARANVERAKRDRIDAELILLTTARTLETLTGISPSAVSSYLVDDLQPEGSLQEWLASQDTPSDRMQRRLDQAATSAKRAAAAALLPTLSAHANERITNATGFAGQAAFYTLQGVLTWRLDYSAYSTAQAQAAAAEVQQIRAERARRGVEDRIYDAYHRVDASIAASNSARAEAKAAENAAVLALERYQAGALTQLDVVQSQRDAFQAEAARVKADSDLAYARALLRIAAGKPIPDETPSHSQLVSSEPAPRQKPAEPPGAALSREPQTTPSEPSPVEPSPSLSP